MHVTERQIRRGHGLIVLLGLFVFASILAFHNITEGDLWAQLAIGESIWEHGRLSASGHFRLHAHAAPVDRP